MRKNILVGLTALTTLGWAGAAHADDGGWSLHGFGDLSLKNDYVTPRGLVVTSTGATVQVLNGVVLSSPGGINLFGTAWVDLNPGHGDGNTNSLNEFDYSFGVSGNIAPKLEAGMEYSQFISGQNAYRDEHNLEFSLKYHDDGKVSINPYAKVFWAISGDSTVVYGKKGKTFDVELGAVPTYKLPEGVTISAPTWITVGPKSYWGSAESGGTPDSNFGVVSTGLKVSAPFKWISSGGHASVYASAQYYHLINDNLVAAKALINSGDHKRDQVVVAAGLSWGF